MFAAPTRKYCEWCEFLLAERLHNLVSRNKQCRVQPEGNERYVQSTSGPWGSCKYRAGPAAPQLCWSIQPARPSILGLMIRDAFVWPGRTSVCLTTLALPGDCVRRWSLSQGSRSPRGGRTAAKPSHDPTIAACPTDQQSHAKPFISTVTTFLRHSFCSRPGALLPFTEPPPSSPSLSVDPAPATRACLRPAPA